MITLARWLRALISRRSLRQEQGRVGVGNQPDPPLQIKVRRYYEDKAMRAELDYDDKGVA